MSPERRRRIEEVFEAILDEPRSEWEEALKVACGEDADLQAEVRRLLVAHERAEGLLERDPGFGSLGTGRSARPPADERIGRYRLVQEIGRGGMGTVYLAERADGHFRQRVALKVISSADEDLQARVVAERQILASLQHPNIARLLDGGVTEDGRPYLVMEYVSGLPIDVYCDRMRLSLRERLKVFLTVLGAVEHAHRNLVVHRDLKPSNILVSPAGEVKLLDFGIAKLLNPNLGGGDAPVTRVEDRALTPEYASPEQVRGEVITTAADVYSLGIILYEILSGYRPYSITDASLPALVKAICEKDPAPPSARVQGQGAQDPDDPARDLEHRKAVAAARYTTSSRHPRTLKGDLDAIVMKALRKEPGRRYTSLELLGQDIQHFLDGLPVSARRGSTLYKVRKLVRRHHTGALAAVVATLSLLGGAGVAGWQAGVAGRERDRAQTALRESEEVTEFLLGLFDTSDPLETPGDTVNVLDLVRRGRRRADSLHAEPEVRARLLQVLSQANHNLGQYGEAQALATEAVDLLERAYGDSYHGLAEALARMGMALSASGEYDSARVVLTRALRSEEKWHGSDVPEMADILENLARVSIYLGDLAGAEEEAERAVFIKERYLGRDDPSTLNTLGALASIYRFQGRYDLSESAFREVLDRRRALPDPDPTRLAGDMLQLGNLLEMTGKGLDEAEDNYRSAVQILHDGDGMSSPNFVWGLTSLASLLEAKGELDEAEQLLSQALAVRRRTYGENHPLVTESLGEYAGFLARNGRAEEGVKLFREAVEIDLRTVGPNHSRHAGTLAGLAVALTETGSLEEADSLMARAIQIRSDTQGARTPVVAQDLSTRADVNILMGNYAAAETYLNQAQAIAREHDLQGIIPERIHRTFAHLYEAWGKPEAADRHRRSASRGS